MALLCAVLSLGRLYWWFEAPWIGWSLALALVLIVSAIVFEHNRSNPLLNTRWLSSGSIVRLGLIMLLIRIVLAEQNTGVIGWLQYVGLQNEQMTHLAWSIFAGIVCGIVTSCLTIKPTKLAWPIISLAGAYDCCLPAGQPVEQPDPPGPADAQPVPAGLRQRLLPRARHAGRHWRGNRRSRATW